MDNCFSIIIPCYNKGAGIGRCLQSLISQTYGNFEVIVIDDGSTDDSRNVIKSFLKDKRFRAFFMPTNNGRLVARNTGMRMARNKWICWLDGDDEYMSNYLELYNKAINDNSDYKIFTSGMLIHEKDYDGYRIIPPFDPGEDNDGMKTFDKGNIGAGSFIFNRDLMWFFPEDALNPDGLENSLPERLVAKDDKFKEICKQNEEGHWLPLGNPYGDDYSYYWYLTRKNKSKMINAILYIQHVRD